MPAFVRKRGNKFRVMENKGGKTVVVKNRSGTAVDGGGHSSRKAAERQARAINAS